jgi:hypothetical protein
MADTQPKPAPHFVRLALQKVNRDFRGKAGTLKNSVKNYVSDEIAMSTIAYAALLAGAYRRTSSAIFSRIG